MECSSEHQEEIGCQTLESMVVGSTKAGPTERKPRPADMQAQRCPRCDSTNTKFCYYNNYSLSQPRYFCKSCRRYWTKGGTIRNVPVGGGCRRKTTATRRTSSSSSKKTLPVEEPHQYPSIGNLQTLQTDHSSRGMTWNIPRPLGDLDSGLPIWRRLGEPGSQPFHSGMMGLSFGWGAATGSEVGTTDIRGLMWSSALPEVGRDGNMVDGRTVAGWGGVRPYGWQGVLSSPLM